MARQFFGHYWSLVWKTDEIELLESAQVSGLFWVHDCKEEEAVTYERMPADLDSPTWHESRPEQMWAL